MLLSFWLWGGATWRITTVFSQHPGTSWRDSCPSTSQRETPLSRSQTGPRPAASVQPGFCPAPAWSRPEALIMFAGCFEYKRQCPEAPLGFSQACLPHPPIWGAE